jgi:hypothetical protein
MAQSALLTCKISRRLHDDRGGGGRVDIVWSSLAWPGTEHVVWAEGSELRADSLAVHDLPDGPARVSYHLIAERDGRTRQVRIETTGAATTNRLTLTSDGNGAWSDGSGRPLPTLQGCLDVDISSTPLTNTLPIRRLRLAPGASGDLIAAYVEVPQLHLRAVRQRYTRLRRGASTTVYRYQSGSFQADLTVDAHDLVLDYPGLWQRSGGRRGD